MTFMVTSYSVSTFGARLQEAIERDGRSQAQIARDADVSERTLIRWGRQDEPPSMKRSDSRKNLEAIAKALGVKGEWLLTGEGPMREETLVQEGQTDYEAKPGENGLMYVPLATIRGSAGDGEEPFDRIVERYQAYDRAQLRRDTGVDPHRLIMLRVIGNSMKPTLRAGDRVLVARYEGEPIVGEAIYVFHRHTRGVVIKRAYWTEEGDLLLRSDNRTEPVDMRIRPNDEHEWQCVGRVVKVEKAL